MVLEIFLQEVGERLRIREDGGTDVRKGENPFLHYLLSGEAIRRNISLL